jgi:glycosyltransferase involved in cell wall biosynthesis
VLHEKTGYLFTYNDTRQFVNYTVRLCTDQQLRETFEQQALQFARGFDWQQITDKMQRVITARLRNGEQQLP